MVKNWFDEILDAINEDDGLGSFMILAIIGVICFGLLSLLVLCFVYPVFGMIFGISIAVPLILKFLANGRK